MEAAEKRGLELHPDKTMILSNERHRQDNQTKTRTKIKDFEIEIVPYDGSAKYLGRKVCFNSFRDTEVDNRSHVAWKKFYAMKDVLCNTTYSLSKRVRLFDSTITTAVLYGASAWTMTCELVSRLRKTQRRMLRSIFQKGRRRVPAADGSISHDSADIEIASEESGEELEPWHEWIQRTTHEIELEMGRLSVEDWVGAQRRRQFRWAGHLFRRYDQRWSSLILDFVPEDGKGRVQARPRKRWDERLVKYFTELGVEDWRLLAGCRNEWKLHEEDFVKFVC